jgi:hemolysin type calcium-binding protein/WD40 repeat protein
VEHVGKQFALLVAALVAVLLLAGQLARAAAGPGPNDPQDYLPAFSSNGVDVAFQRDAGLEQRRVLDMTSAGRSTHVTGYTSAFRGWVPGTEHLLVQQETDDMLGQTIVTTDSVRDAPLATLHGIDATASPDGKRVAYLRLNTLYVASIDGKNERAVASSIVAPSWDLAGPVWSPDGARIAIASGSSLLLVNADGSGSRTLFSGANQSVNPSWSPDGKTIAFERNFAPHWEIWTVSPAGGDAAALLRGSANFRYPVFSPVSKELAYISDLQHAKGGATQYQFALYLHDPTGVSHKLLDDVHPYSRPAWSPTAALIAVAAGQECRRWGIYVGRSNVGAAFHRRSNLCRFDGDAAANRIGGSPWFDIVNGNGGNDVLNGYRGNDKISGESGNDTILGGDGNDFVLAGPGDDHIYGGNGNDVIIPGNGRDVVDCGPGNDTVDGSGPLDRIAKNCEHVRH